MTLWDGLTSANEAGLPARILILGATNRIQDIDEAILRRMPKKFPVSLPSKPQRRRILKLILKDTKVDPEQFDLEYLTRVTAGMSGSDIKEACRDAAMVPVREFIRAQRERGVMAGVQPESVRGVRTEDFFGRKGGGQIIRTITLDILARRMVKRRPKVRVMNTKMLRTMTRLQLQSRWIKLESGRADDE